MQTELLKQLHELQYKIEESENRNQQLIKKQVVLEEKFKNLITSQALYPENNRVPELLATTSSIISPNEIILQQIFQQSLDAMLILSAQGAIVATNEAACALSDYPAQELLQLNYGQIVDQDDPNPELFKQPKASPLKYKGELVLVRKNGQRFSADLSSYGCSDQDGQIKYFVIIRKISDQPESLLRSSYDYRELFNKTNDAILIFDVASGHIYDANNKACKLYGYSLAEFTTLSLSAIAKDITREKQYLRQLRELGTLKNLETVQYRKDGAKLYLSLNASFIQFNNRKAVLSIINDITEQKRTEKILFESEERFSAFMENSPVLAWMKNTRNWQYTYLNSTHKQVLGLAVENAIGKTDFDIWPENIASALRQNDMQAAELPQAVKYREEVILPDGSAKQFLVYKFPIKTAYGDSYVGGTGIDITDLLQTQQALEQSELRYRAILNSAMECIISMDENGNIAEFNSASEKTFGYTREAIIGTKLSDLIIPPRISSTSTNKLADFFQTNVRELAAQRMELIAKRSNGDEFPVELSITVSGELSKPFFTGIIRDISERKVAEDALRRSEKHFRVITENMTDLVCLHEPDGKITYISPSVQDILGFKPEEVIDASPYTFIHPDDKGKSINSVLAVLSGQQSVKNIEYRIQRKDGRYIWLDTGLRPIFNEAGNVVEVQTVSREITARKKTERKLKKAKEAAEISSTAKESFLANMSHEIRTPLNGILGMAGLLTKTLLNEAQQKYLNIIDYSARNLLVIINDILDLAKIESGKLILEQIPFNILEVLQSTQQALEYKAEEKDILLIVKSFNLNNPYVVGDPHRLTQVLLNLVSNAIKFTSQGVVVIRTEILEETATHLRFLITVKDTGIGIPKEKQELIFDNFTQADPHTSRNYGGTGLGLTICKNLIEKQGGRIWVESTPGIGSEFKFELSFRKAAPDQIKEVISDTESVDFSSLGHLRILLAEDNEVNQFLAKSIMQNWGFTIDVAKNGKEAVALAASRDYDLILMDIQMPEVNGTEATQQIRQLPDSKKAHTPIIALTANALKGDAEQFIAAGMNDYLAKPFEEGKLFQKIAANLANPHSLSTKSTYTLKEILTVTNSSNPVPAKLCDLTMLQTMANGKNDFLIKFFELFIQQVPPQVQAMQVAATQSNWPTVTSLAHQLKSNFDTLGITSLQQPIRDLENYAREQSNLTTIPNLIAHVQNTVEQAIQELQAEITRLRYS